MEIELDGVYAFVYDWHTRTVYVNTTLCLDISSQEITSHWVIAYVAFHSSFEELHDTVNVACYRKLTEFTQGGVS